MPEHPLTAVGGGASLYVQETEPTETPQPAPDGDGGVWYPLTVFSGGDEQWSFTTGGDVTSGVAIDSGTAVVGSADNNVYGLDITDGSQQWSFTTGDIISSNIEITNGTAVVGNATGNAYGLAVSDGTEQWNFTTGSEFDRFYGVAIDNGTVVFGVNNGNAYGVNVTDGTEQWEFTTTGNFAGGAAIADNTAVLGNVDDNAYGLRVQTVSKYDTPKLSDGTNWVNKL